MCFTRFIPRAIIMTLIIISLLLPCVFFNAGIGRMFNKYAIRTECIINNTYIKSTVCTYTCGCIEICRMGINKELLCYNSCQICNSICNEAHMLICLVNDFYQSKIADVIFDKNASIQKFEHTHQPHDLIGCYYYESTGEIRLNNNENDNYYYTYIMSTIAAVFLFIIYIGLELIRRKWGSNQTISAQIK